MLLLRDTMPSFTHRKKYLRRKSKVFQLFELAGKRKCNKEIDCLVIESPNNIARATSLVSASLGLLPLFQ